MDSYSELCTWNIDITVDKDMIAVSCGDLVETVCLLAINFLSCLLVPMDTVKNIIP